MRTTAVARILRLRLDAPEPSGTDGYYIELNKKPNLSHSVSA